MLTNKRWLLPAIYCMTWLFSLYVVLQYVIYSPSDAGMVAAKLEDSTFPYTMWQVFFYPHILLGLLALLIGAFQLGGRSRSNSQLHKKWGRIYGLSIFLNALIVPYIALYATGGTPSTIAFMVLDLFWVVTTGIGVRQVLGKKIASHRIWMLRSYAITLVFITFRIVLAFLSLYSHDFSMIFPVAVYASIVINLGFAEVYLRKRRSGLHV